MRAPTRATLIFALLAWPLAAAEPPVDQIILQARFAERVRGDLENARKLYKRALDDRSLTDKARQAELRVRIAYCYMHAGLRPDATSDKKALAYLAPSIYAPPEIPPRVRAEAEKLRGIIRDRQPKTATEPSKTRDNSAEVSRLVAEHLSEARRHLARNHLFYANGAVQKALALQPDNPDARALEGQIQTEILGFASFLESPLDFLKSWSEAHVKTVARGAREHVRTALAAYRAREFAKGEQAFSAAIAAIDACEFADASTELIELRETIRERWRALREHHFGKAKAEPKIAVRKARGTPAADYVKQLQRMLDFISSPDHEYRLLPVTPRRGAVAPRSQQPPRGFVLERGPAPSTWTLARFAHLYVPRHIERGTWTRLGNFLDTAGEMLVARNRPTVLDKVQKELRRLEAPKTPTLPTEFLLVSVPDTVLEKFGAKFGKFESANERSDAMLARVIPAEIPLERICGWLSDEGVDVRIERDRFEALLANGRPATLLAGRPIGSAHGYEKARIRSAPPIQRDYGVLLDLLPLRAENGRTSIALKVSVRQPVPPVPVRQTRTVPRFLTQTVTGFADLPAGSTLAVAGLVDPFGPGRGEQNTGRSLLLLWRSPAGPRTARAREDGDTREIPLRRLFYDVHADDPGPKVDAVRGFVDVGPHEVLARRARFLEERLRVFLPETKVIFDWQDAVLRVPSKANQAGVDAIVALERQARRTFVVEVEARVVKTSVFQRWMKREGIEPKSWGEAQLATSDVESGGLLLRNLPESRPDDPFAPRARWAVLGLQARHLRSTRSRTAPGLHSEEALARRATDTVTEGVRITVRPYLLHGQQIRANVSVETAGILELREERAAGSALPSYRPVVEGTRASGTVDFGTRTAPRTALVCRIPHPTASRPEQLLEVVIAMNIRLQ
ncbi:MAG: hypothetical protein ACYTGZ_04415 [Planctomycetota bacterium]|jgi:hypothetical protein